jgi:hypothetical protein
MSKRSIFIDCPGCTKASQVFLTRKPTHFTPVVSRLNCDNCNSRFLVGIQKGDDSRKVRITTDPIFLSEKARANLKAWALERLAAEAKKADPPEQPVASDNG